MHKGDRSFVIFEGALSQESRRLYVVILPLCRVNEMNPVADCIILKAALYQIYRDTGRPLVSVRRVRLVWDAPPGASRISLNQSSVPTPTTIGQSME